VAADSSGSTASLARRRTIGIPNLVYDNHPVDQPKLPEQGYHLTEDLTDRRSSSSRTPKTVAPEKPFFLYYAPGAAHAPHHVSKEWADKFRGQFDMGYEAIREQTLARQKEMGIVPADTGLPPVNPVGSTGNPHGTVRPAVPADGLHPAMGLADRRGEAAVRPDGRGIRGVPGPRRPPHRAPARLPGRVRAAGGNTMVVLVSDNGAKRGGLARTGRSTR